MSYKTKYILFSFSLLLCFSCQENDGQAKPEPPQEKIEIEVEIPKSASVRLTPEAKAETAKWLAFITAQSDVSEYRKNGAGYAIENAQATLQIMKNLQESIPEKFRVTPVETRINVLVSLAQVLKQESENRNPDEEETRETAKKIVLAFENLKIQLNEVFAQPLEDLRQELEDNSDSVSIPRPMTLLKKNAVEPL